MTFKRWAKSLTNLWFEFGYMKILTPLCQPPEGEIIPFVCHFRKCDVARVRTLEYMHFGTWYLILDEGAIPSWNLPVHFPRGNQGRGIDVT